MQKKNLIIILLACLISYSAFGVESALQAENQKPFVDFDIAGSAGTYNGNAYTEIHMGLNLNFTEWLTWRNAIFKRMTSGSSSEETGLDSSLRFVYETTGINFYAGPGYRWAQNSDKNALMAEAGLNIKLAALVLGGGVKYLKYDKAQYSSAGTQIKQEDFNYFITFSGGTGWTF